MFIQPHKYKTNLPVTSGLQCRFESKLIEGLVDGDLVSQWNDTSGNLYHATATGSSRPTYKVNSRGYPCVRFAGDPQYLTLGNPFSITNTVTIFSVFNVTEDDYTHRQTIFGQNNTSLAVSLEVNGSPTGVSAPRDFPIRGVITTGVNVNFASSANSAKNITETLVYRKSGSGSGTHTFRVNGRLLTNIVDGTGNITGNGNKDIGRRAASSQYFVGDMFALLIYNRSLTDQEVSDVEQYLMSQYQDDQYELRYLGTGATDASGIQQGCAWDGTHYYETSTSQGGGTGYMRKLTRPVDSDTYTEVLERDVTGDWSTGNGAGCLQENGVHYYNGYLWVGGNNYPETTPKKGYIFQRNPSDMSLVNAWNTTEAAWCEGGAWHDVGDGNGVCYWTVFHNSFVTEQYNSSMVLLNSYTKPDMNSQYGADNLHQGAVWFTDPVSGYHFMIAPCHESGTKVNSVDIYRWNGSGFDGWQRMEMCVAYGSQGNHWGRLAGATPNIGDEMIFSKRGTGQGIQRTVFKRRGRAG